MSNPKLLFSVLMINLLVQPLSCLAGEKQQDLFQSTNLSTIKETKIKPGLSYSKLQWNGSTVHCLNVDTKNKSLKITPFITEKVKEPSLSIFDSDAVFVVNGGFFNLSDGESTSYVTIDGKSMCEPKQNKALVENPKLKPFLPQIFDRSEIRFLKNQKNESVIEIVNHSKPVQKGLTLEAALQGGPQILPKMTSELEAFIRKDDKGKMQDSIGTKRKAARTAVGITGDGKLVILCAEGGKKKDFAEGVSLDDLSQMFEYFKCQSALNFDGGTSTAMVVNPQKLDQKNKDFFSEVGVSGLVPPDGVPAQLIYGASPERRVKSTLCVIEASKK
ncbi:MAG: phosphodiester glycosidase family protein [Candidatus Melainabacteria bacterium]|nr:phosphodiester glycosidase family protein [Candidatus Melainabacteria bacterium]